MELTPSVGENGKYALGIAMQCNSLSSNFQTRHCNSTSAGRLSSHAIPVCHSDWNICFARTVKGVSPPSGSNTEVAVRRRSLLVSWFWLAANSGGRKVSSSSCGFQETPRVFHKQLYLSLKISSVGRSTNASGALLRQMESPTGEQLRRPMSKIPCLLYGVTTNHQVVYIHTCHNIIDDSTETVTLLS
ncbi:hypothetical protein T4B_13530 [Trichinella pseudospiralis]|uniref:Uncharacterized protein n=1 Tax=Trichinella pseudospiralis TaxID=6337 RepID=A0A0V1GT23_TRIPS|nr:hypothetical protein T4B_13530 [Trichinella pseudospiralis]